MESPESASSPAPLQRLPTGLSFGDGFQFGCGFFTASLIAAVILILLLALLLFAAAAALFQCAAGDALGSFDRNYAELKVGGGLSPMPRISVLLGGGVGLVFDW